MNGLSNQEFIHLLYPELKPALDKFFSRQGVGDFSVHLHNLQEPLPSAVNAFISESRLRHRCNTNVSLHIDDRRPLWMTFRLIYKLDSPSHRFDSISIGMEAITGER